MVHSAVPLMFICVHIALFIFLTKRESKAWIEKQQIALGLYNPQ